MPTLQPRLYRQFRPEDGVPRMARVMVFVAPRFETMRVTVDTGCTHSCLSVWNLIELGLPVPQYDGRVGVRQTAQRPVTVKLRPPVTIEAWWSPTRRGDPFRWTFNVFDVNPFPLLGLNDLVGCRWLFDGVLTTKQPLGAMTLRDVRRRPWYVRAVARPRRNPTMPPLVAVPPADLAERVAYAKAVIAEQIRPQLPTLPEIEAYIDRRFPGLPPQTRRCMAQGTNLSRLYGGRGPVAYFARDETDQFKVPLAFGYDEYYELCRGLTPAEIERIGITYPDDWDQDEWNEEMTAVGLPVREVA